MGFVPAYIRELCAQEKYKEEFGAIKFSGRWILQKDKIEQYAKAKKSRLK
ncbi:unnamed protein product [marine sediment metagenome]|uniref:Uncharacterized protein n=1 Tax=marine sediment metagenome TaxID=412755 RepID=X1TN62_9ZZZZ